MKLSGRGSQQCGCFPISESSSGTYSTKRTWAFLAGILLLLLPGVALTSAYAQGPVALSPAALSFGNHYVGGPASAYHTVTLTNSQTVPLSISGVALSGSNLADFAMSNFCPTRHPLGAGLSCAISVRFQPSALGTRTATLTFTDSASGSPQTVALTGVGLAPASVAPASLAFAGQSVGTTSVVATVTLTNNLNSTLSLSAVSASGDFAVVSDTCGSSLAALARCSIGVTFTPTASGARTGVLSIPDSVPGSPILVALSGTGNQTQAKGIQYVVIIFQENRTPDNLFQDPVLIANGADIASSGLNSAGQTVELTPMDLGTKGSSPQLYDLDHGHGSFVLMYDHGKMDGADKIQAYCLNSAPCPSNPQFKYVSPSDVGPYFQLAEQYTFGDRMFQTNQGPSFPAHQFIISGTSAPTAASTSFAMGNVVGGSTFSPDGCIAPPSDYVLMINPVGKTTRMYPCFEHGTLTDLLEAAGFNWRYYTPSTGGLWTAPNAIEHMCGPNAPPPNATACTGPDFINNVVPNSKAILQDIANGTLANVSFVMPSGAASDHASVTDGSGPSWVASIVNALGASPYWPNTAVIITWDDWGGWYDHVAPQVIDDGVSWGSGYVYGFRVPLIVVSPYAKPGYVSHVTHDFGSILNFIEQVYNLPSLGYADAHADDLSYCFDFSQNLVQFRAIRTPLKAEHFLNDHTPETAPDND